MNTIDIIFNACACLMGMFFLVSKWTFTGLWANKGLGFIFRVAGLFVAVLSVVNLLAAAGVIVRS